MKTHHAHTLDGHSAPVYAGDLDRERGVLYTGGGDGMVGAWDVERHEPDAFSVRVGKAVYAIRHDAAGDRLYVGQAEGGIHVIDRGARAEIRHLKYHEGPVFDLLLHRQKNHLYSAGSEGNLAITDLDDHRLKWSIPVSASKLRVLRLSPDGRLLMAGASDGRIRTFETEYFNEVSVIEAHEGGVYCMELLRDGTLLTGGRDGHLRHWRIRGDSPEPLEAIPAHNYAIYSIALHPELPLVVSGSRDRKVKIWPLHDWKNAARIERRGPVGHTHSVNVVGWSAADEVFSIGDDRKLYFWRVEGLNVSPEASR